MYDPQKRVRPFVRRAYEWKNFLTQYYSKFLLLPIIFQKKTISYSIGSISMSSTKRELTPLAKLQTILIFTNTLHEATRNLSQGRNRAEKKTDWFWSASCEKKIYAMPSSATLAFHHQKLVKNGFPKVNLLPINSFTPLSAKRCLVPMITVNWELSVSQCERGLAASTQLHHYSFHNPTKAWLSTEVRHY